MKDLTPINKILGDANSPRQEQYEDLTILKKLFESLAMLKHMQDWKSISIFLSVNFKIPSNMSPNSEVERVNLS